MIVPYKIPSKMLYLVDEKLTKLKNIQVSNIFITNVTGLFKVNNATSTCKCTTYNTVDT